MSLLNQIIADKKLEIATVKKRISIKGLKLLPFFNLKTRDFHQALSKQGIKIIAEIKQASPSKGIIVKNFNLNDIARIYEKSNCDAISVLTENKYFKGSLNDLKTVKKLTTKPILRKDFIFDEYQIYESRAYGADALLLICNILQINQLKNLLDLTKKLKMNALVEVHNEEDLEKALACKADIIGINNRNLKTFNVDLQTTIKLSGKITGNIIKVSESGIKTPKDIKLLYSKGVSVFLIGESILQSEDSKSFILRLKRLRNLND